VAGIFAFAPIQEATTVHTSGTTTLAAGGIGVGDFATGAITADSVATDAVTEISGALPRLFATPDSTAINSVQGTTQSSTYTLTVNETVEIIAIEVTGNISSFSTSADIINVNGFDIDGFGGLNVGGVLQVNNGGDGAGDTIEVFTSDWNDGATLDDTPTSSYILTPNVTTGFEVTVEVIEAGSNDDNAAIPITVTFYYYGSSTSGGSIAVT